jgi:hypothetical protein
MLALDQDALDAHLSYWITPVFEKLRLQTSPDETRGDKQLVLKVFEVDATVLVGRCTKVRCAGSHLGELTGDVQPRIETKLDAVRD